LTEADKATRGETLRVFDVHTHAFPDKVAKQAMPKLVEEALWFPVEPTHDGTLGGLLASMDRAGIEKAVVCSVATKPEQVPKITDWSVAIASERIVPFPSIHPGFGEPEAEVERIAEAGLKGIKLHPYYMDCMLDDPRVVRVVKAAAKADLAVALHTGYDLAYEKCELGSPASVRRLHEAAPEARLLACHMGGWERWEDALEQVAGLPVYLETSMTLGRCDPDLLGRLFEKHPAEYLVFGTDSPWADQKEDLARFMALPIPEEVKRRAVWENGHRYAGLPL
jgi:hypothetical protein